MRPRRALVGAFVLTLISLVIPGCADLTLPESPTPPPPPEDFEAPIVDFRQFILPGYSYCAHMVRFGVNASPSTDNLAEPSELEARFDFEDDGEWDTDWRRLELVEYYPDALPDSLWTTRCQVRDPAGNVSEAVQTFDIRSSLLIPEYPDIVGGPFRVNRPEKDLFYRFAPGIISVDPGEMVNYDFYVGDWVTNDETEYKLELYLGPDLLWEQWRNPSVQIGWCFYFQGVDTALTVPGEHLMRLVVDAENDFAEAQEGNNVAELVIRVLDSAAE